MNKFLLIFWGADIKSSENPDKAIFDNINKIVADLNKYHSFFFDTVFIKDFHNVLDTIEENIFNSKITLIIGAEALSDYLNLGNAQNVIKLIISFPEINILFSKWNEMLFIPEGKVKNPQKLIEPIERYINGEEDALNPFEGEGEGEGEGENEIKGILDGDAKDPQRKIDQLSSLRSRCLKTLAHSKISTDMLVLDEKKLYAQLSSFDNLFDISNLRYAAKIWKNAQSKLYYNYKKLIENRAEHVGYSIDAEAFHSSFCAYSLFSRGYRSMAISSWAAFDYIFGGLEEAENNNSKDPDHKLDILIRDFDLQFGDDDENHINQLRGYTYSENKWKNCKDSFNILTSDKSYCVSNRFNEEFPYNFDNVGKNGNIRWPNGEISEDLKIPGTDKPVCGVNSLFINKLPINFILEIRESKGDDNYLIKRYRVGRDHASPLDLYEIAQPLISRAEHYYQQQKYIHAAVLSQEAIEILNGFHISLSLRAYHIHAIAENAIAMNVLGGKESELAIDCEERIRQVGLDINRLLYKSGQDSTNVLNQIFSDCRNYCKEKEHFESEDVFLSAMAELNEGGLRPLLRKIKNFFTS